MVVMAQ